MKTFKEYLKEAEDKEKKKRPEFEPGGVYAHPNPSRDKMLRSLLDTGKSAIFKGKKVKLDLPFRIVEDDPSKYRVYHDSGRKDKDGNIIAKKIDFGSRDLSVKNFDDDRRYSFQKRHNCAAKKDPSTAGFWSCHLHLFHKQLGLSSPKPW
jgi:hypothetical protein